MRSGSHPGHLLAVVSNTPSTPRHYARVNTYENRGAVQRFAELRTKAFWTIPVDFSPPYAFLRGSAIPLPYSEVLHSRASMS